MQARHAVSPFRTWPLVPLTEGISKGLRALRHHLIADAGRLAAVSSFGADSAVRLALVAEVDPASPVLFLDTGKHFAATPGYRQEPVRLPGLRDIAPAWTVLRLRDPHGQMHARATDACCGLRKVTTVAEALAPFAVWVTGRRPG
jgi:phosphoadenosine phosphosulfate reductase